MNNTTSGIARTLGKLALLSAVLMVTAMGSLSAQIEHLEPPNWWIGMKNPRVTLMVHGKNMGAYTVKTDYPGVEIVSATKADSPNYLFVTLEIGPEAEAGEVDLTFSPNRGRKRRYSFPLLEREKPAEEYVGFDSSDAIYLITPDRFANGDPSNDAFKDLREKELNREDDYGRHGGDIAGIAANIDYIHDLGFTAIWPCPLLINDMPRSSYHGYAITDYYRVDPRFGTLEEYKALADSLDEKGMKLIMDQVANHAGSGHWWMKDLPFRDWLSNQEFYEEGTEVPTSNHRRTVNQDRYASQVDRKGMSGGWFVSAMPDLNQRNSFMAEYIIQNSIWWIETLGLGGIRQDTYPYPDKDFMANWARSIMEEYPNFNIVGEEWSYNPLLVGYWQDGANNHDGYRSYLKTPMDFPLQRAIVQGLREEERWDTGLVKIYEGLANDFAYPNPSSIMLFPDNHDMDRILTQLDLNADKVKQALALIAVFPRIPQFYYGTEILMENSAKPGDHGLIRSEFPGGWPDHQKSAFTGEGLTSGEKEMQQFVRSLFTFRKESEVLHTGKTVHFAPRNGVYVLARYTGDKRVLLALNKNSGEVALDLEDAYGELGLTGRQGIDVLSGQQFIAGSGLQVPAEGLRLISFE